MRITQHTTGPWVYRKTGTWPETNHDLGIYADSAMMPQVAKVEGMGVTSEANARLIAAAPELLAALKMCVIEKSEWLKEAKKVIARATGDEV